MRARLLIGVLSLAGAVSLFAQKKPGDKPEPPWAYSTPVYLTPEEGGMEYKIQGEYLAPTGPFGTEPWGAQVVARGKGTFELVLIPGGLPGDGGRSAERKVAEGKLADSVAVFAGEAEGRADGQVLTVQLSGGKQVEFRRKIRTSPTLGMSPPEGAIPLFTGQGTEHWSNAQVDERGLLKIGAKTKTALGGGALHVEFLVPFRPEARNYVGGNSGIIFMSSYEIQVFDSFGQKPNNHGCGAAYNFAAPMESANFPPLTWQTYDIDFEAPILDATGRLVEPARATVQLNGILVQDRTPFPKPNIGKGPDVATGPLLLQGHNEPVFFRNVWFRPSPASRQTAAPGHGGHNGAGQ